MSEKKQPPMVTKTCKVCGDDFQVSKYRIKYKHTCSQTCRVKASAAGRSTGVTLVTRPCPECGAVFSVAKGLEKNKQYCTPACGRANKTRNQFRQDTRSCAACGTAFTVVQSSPQRTCSYKCAGIAKRKQQTRYCKTCEKPFQVHEKSVVRYCSLECGYQGQSTPRAPRTIKVCPTCDKPFKVLTSAAGSAKYCSRKCLNQSPSVLAARAAGQAGDKHPRYNPDRVTVTSASGKTYRRDPIERELARSAKRRSAKKQAVPGWFDKEVVDAIYAKAKRLTDLTGDAFHVDHIVPLTSDIVCGLHWSGNLQILPGTENLSKANRYWPDMP